MDFKVGDVVRLKSGGPSMTVAAVHGEGPKATRVSLVWFANGVCRGDINAVLLEKV